MDAITLSDARRRLSEVAEQAITSPVFITRARGETLVLMSAAELSSIMETARLMSTQANRDSLSRALKDFDEGNIVHVSVDDL